MACMVAASVRRATVQWQAEPRAVETSRLAIREAAAGKLVNDAPLLLHPRLRTAPFVDIGMAAAGTAQLAEELAGQEAGVDAATAVAGGGAAEAMEARLTATSVMAAANV